MDAAGRFTIRLVFSRRCGGSPSHSVQRCPAIALAISVMRRLTAATPAASITVRGYAAMGMARDDVTISLRVLANDGNRSTGTVGAGTVVRKVSRFWTV